jgi:hypothetical protein
MLLGENEGGAGFALGIERIKSLLQAFFGGFSCVNRAAGLFWPAGALSFPVQPLRPPMLGRSAPVLSNPKKRGPDQCAPVIFWAILVSDG